LDDRQDPNKENVVSDDQATCWFTDVDVLGCDVRTNATGAGIVTPLWVLERDGAVVVTSDRFLRDQYWTSHDEPAESFLQTAVDLVGKVREFDTNIAAIMHSVTDAFRPIDSVYLVDPVFQATRRVLSAGLVDVSLEIDVFATSNALHSTWVDFRIDRFGEKSVFAAGSFWLARDVDWNPGEQFVERVQAIKRVGQELAEQVTAHLHALGIALR
jgi:hypothetical protein